MLRIRPVENEETLRDARFVRRRVFVEEQDVDPDLEWDGRDERARLVVGYADDGNPVATARWRAATHDEELVAKLERFAVLPAHRGRGYGRRLVEVVTEDARQAGFRVHVLHAQRQVEAFYAALGFQTIGEPFTEAGIPHVKMIRRVTDTNE